MIWRRERPAYVGIYGNLMTRANVLAIAQRGAGMRMARGAGRTGAGELSGGVSGCRADAIVNGEGEVSLEALLRAARARLGAGPGNSISRR